MNTVSIIIPCYFNEKNIPCTTQELIENEKLFPSGVAFEYVMIDDGSKDGTYNELLKFKERFPDKVKVIKLSGNFGSYNAILAGMEYATGDCNVVIAADLQDPPELIAKMYEYWTNGLKLVLANRQKREDSLLDRYFAIWYHRIIKKYALKELPEGGFDFCLFDKKLKEEVLSINERNTNSLFLLVWLKYDFVSIPYIRRKRSIGKSRWTIQKKVKLLIDSFVSFSFFPIRLISVMGLLLGFAAILYSLFIFFGRISGLISLKGWTALMMTFLFVSSFQMVAIGIIGEYLWRTLDASRGRPNFIVEKTHV